MVGTVVFLVFSLLAISCLIISGYTGIRWATSGAEVTHESHLDEIERGYKELDAATMIVEFQNMEKNSLDLIIPYKYQTENDEKSRWGWNSIASLAIAFVSGGIAIAAASAGRADPSNS